MHNKVLHKPVKDPKKKKGKGNRTLTIIFYTLYCILIVSFLAGIYYANNQLTKTLTQYEDSHITVQTEKTFQKFFSQPDWAKLYDMAGIEDTPFEGVEAYVSYMEATVGNAPLTYSEIPSDATGRFYQVKLGDTVIGSFQMTDQRKPDSKWPCWQMEALALETPRTVTVQIRKLDHHTVTVNGVPLDDSHTLRIDTLLAEEYTLPGTKGIALELQELTDLMVLPEIAIWDQDGNPCPLTLNPETGIYDEQLPDPVHLTAEQERLVLDSAKAWGAYKLRNASEGNLSLYFDPKENAFRTISSGLFWTDTPSGYTLESLEIPVSQVYSDKHFSAYVSFRAKQNGTETRYIKDATLFFELHRGKWTCYELQPGNVYTDVTKVRLEFRVDNTEIYYDFYETDRTAFYAPLVTAPDGYSFAGWGTEDGQILFTPDQTGLIAIPQGTVLEPAVLHAIFEETEGGT